MRLYPASGVGGVSAVSSASVKRKVVGVDGGNSPCCIVIRIIGIRVSFDSGDRDAVTILQSVCW